MSSLPQMGGQTNNPSNTMSNQGTVGTQKENKVSKIKSTTLKVLEDRLKWQRILGGSCKEPQ